MMAGIDADRLAEIEEDNRRLRRLLDQRGAPGELRHRLRSTLALLKTVIRKSAETRRDLAGYVAHLEDRLDAIARAQAFIDQHGEIDLRTLLADELFQYGASEGERLSLSGPDVRFQPKPGQALALAFHELAVNAVEHGILGEGGGRIEISWDVADAGASLSLSWAERGPAAAVAPAHSGFGTEVLTRMLAYELKAETILSFGPEGLLCSIHLPFPEQVGRVILE